MEKYLKDYLKKGELVCWRSQPSDFPLLDRVSKSSFIRNWIFTVVAVGGLLGVYLSGEVQRSIAFICLVLFIAAGILVSPIWERRKLQGQRYWITNQRVIVMLRGQTFYCMELSTIDRVELADHLADNPCILIGSSLFPDVTKQIRWQACHPKTDLTATNAGDRAIGLVFYCIQNAAEALSILSEYTQRQNQVTTAKSPEIKAVS